MRHGKRRSVGFAVLWVLSLAVLALQEGREPEHPWDSELPEHQCGPKFQKCQCCKMRDPDSGEIVEDRSCAEWCHKSHCHCPECHP